MPCASGVLRGRSAPIAMELLKVIKAIVNGILMFAGSGSWEGNAEGYVHSQQHDGPAHAEGWPFPLWSQAGGIGWHFAPIGVPQVMRRGFLGFRPTAEGCRIDPRLPSDFKELTVTRIHLHAHVLDVRVRGTTIDVTDHGPAGSSEISNSRHRMQVSFLTGVPLIAVYLEAARDGSFSFLTKKVVMFG